MKTNKKLTTIQNKSCCKMIKYGVRDSWIPTFKNPRLNANLFVNYIVEKMGSGKVFRDYGSGFENHMFLEFIYHNILSVIVIYKHLLLSP